METQHAESPRFMYDFERDAACANQRKPLAGREQYSKIAQNEALTNGEL